MFVFGSRDAALHNFVTCKGGSFREGPDERLSISERLLQIRKHGLFQDSPFCAVKSEMKTLWPQRCGI